MSAFSFTSNSLRLVNGSLTRNVRCKSTSNYCVESVRRYDYENFMCTLLLKRTALANAFAIRGFNIEVARVADQVSDPKIGLVRLKFWDEVVDSCFSAKEAREVPRHPVSLDLFNVVRGTKFTKRYFKNLVKARSDNLTVSIFDTLEDMENYSEKSVSNVYYLLLEGVGVRNVNADHAASHLGKAQGLVQQLRMLQLKNVQTIPLPQELLTKCKVSHEEIRRRKSSGAVDECAFEVAKRAYAHLEKSRTLMEKLPKEALDVMLPFVAVETYLTRLEKLGYQIFHPGLQRLPWIWLPKLWIRHFKNKF